MVDIPPLTDTEIAAELAPLTRVIATALHDTPVRLGSPQGAADLAATIAVHVAAYVGREVLPPPDAETKTLRLRTRIAESELRTLRTGIRALGGDPTTIQNLWAQLRLRNRQWRDAKQERDRAQLAVERVRALVTGLAHPTSAGISDYSLGRHDLAVDILAALNHAPEQQ
ncbi:hypothetical protein [Streptomyces acidiscabies]|uniref:Uncharacterized protein n=1 Tax=Streptomyces acidiscabies TaxID=42234 RepID=A0ABU4LYB2_9ACTN|nr:hypothetical protein [Streptomyces acidiscabies]MDX3019897.1 hypothetical protein [Streptomyces acidiscabies]